MSADFVPLDRSPGWRTHDDYFARGVAVWTSGEVPFLSTNNHAMARQHAALLLAHVAALGLGDTEPVYVLEVGGGLGTFAANFHHALDEDLGEEGRRLAARLRYVFTDFSDVVLKQTSAGGELAPLIMAGRVVPMRYDLRRPGELDVPHKFVAVLANYVCCVVGAKHVQRQPVGWAELCVRGDELAWLPTSPAALFADPLHRRVLELVVGDDVEMTVSIPHVFLDFLAGVRPLLRPDALTVITDYGRADRDQLRGLRDSTPTLYGQSFNQDVHFPVLDAWAALTGAHLLRTRDPLLSVHTAILSAVPLLVGDTFKERFIDRHEGQELLDWVAAAREFLHGEAWGRAARAFQRALALDPRNAELHLRLGIAHLEAGRLHDALLVLRRGAALDHWRTHDFDFEIARACSRRGEWAEAVRHYEASLARDRHPTAYTNLGTIHETLGNQNAALRCYLRALAVDPGFAPAKERLAHLKEAWWAQKLEELGDVS